MRVRAIIISNAGRLLLGIAQNGQYGLPGGHIKEGEHPVDALLREIYEETGYNSFENLEYLWQYVDNYVFLFVPKDTIFQPTCSNDPSNEFKALEWVNIETLPSELDEYSEDIIYRFLRLEIIHNGEKEMKVTEASHIDVFVDGKKAFQLDDDTIWLTLPRLAQERSKGKKIEFQQVLDDGAVVDQTPEPAPTKQLKIEKKDAAAYCLAAIDLEYYGKCILLPVTLLDACARERLLNPSVQILKVADTFDNTLLFDGKDEFWITNCCNPIWRSNYLDRYAPYEEVVTVWNKTYPKQTITLDWLKDLVKKIMQTKPVKKKSK